MIGKIGVGGGTGHVIEYRGSADPRDVDGRAHDRLQHVDRGRRARRHDRARRHHVRSTSPAARARRRAPPGTRPSTRWRSLPSDAGARFDREVEHRRRDARADDHLRHEPRHGDPDRRRGAARATATGVRQGARVHAARGRQADAGASRSTSCSSAAAPTRASSRPARRRRRAARPPRRARRARCSSCPARSRSSAQAEAEGLDQRVLRRRRRVARARLLDVHRHERRHVAPRPVLGQHEQPQFRGPPGQRRAHGAREPAHRRGGRGHGSDRRSARAHGVGHGTDHAQSARRTVVLPNDNIDTDQIIPARFLTTTTKDGLGKNLFADWRYDRDGRSAPTSCSTARKPRRADPRSPATTSAAARRASTRRGRCSTSASAPS